MAVFSSDFMLGFVAATLFWLLVSWMVRLFQSYRRRIRAAHSPATGKVPAEVIADANRARFGLVLWFLAVFFGLFVLWEVATWGTRASLIGQVWG